MNEQTKIDQYHLPRIDDALDSLSGARYFSTLDLASGYRQLRVSEEDIEKTAFSCHKELFEFVRMPFGLSIAPATMHRALDILLAHFKWEACLVYLDDVITFGAKFQMLRRLWMIFTLFRSANLHLKQLKCYFGYAKVAYLGHLVSGNGVEVDPEKIRVVKEFPRPTTKTQVRSFLGLACYYRRFIENFAKIALPLHKLMGEKRSLLGMKDVLAFEKLKTFLTEAPVLTMFDLMSV